MPVAQKGFWAHAFQIEPSEPLKEKDKAWMREIAKRIKKRGLVLPAVLALETTKPLHFLAGQTARFADAILSLVVAQDQLKRIAGILERRDGAEYLLKCLEKDELE